VAQAYGIATFTVSAYEDLARIQPEVLDTDGPVICLLRIPFDSPVEPTVGLVRDEEKGTASPRPLEDMAPFLDREEFARAMLVKVLP
jgi:acetolactate synthase-1/2/3 large subunit